MEAVSSGASASIGLVANIAANLIAFLAILGFINSALKWLGGMVGYPDVTFQVRFSNRKLMWYLDHFINFLDFRIIFLYYNILMKIQLIKVI